MAKKNSNDTNRGGFFTSGPQNGKELAKRNPYPSVAVTPPVRASHTFSQQSLIGNQGDGVDRSNPRLYPDITVLGSTKVAHTKPEPGPGTKEQQDHIRRMRENKQLT
jgi:hypothetical protein